MIDTINWDKLQGLIAVVIIDYLSQEVLMVGFMNPQALEQTLATGKVCFFSRTKQRLWEKGETSGNTLWVESMSLDCDQDSLVIYARAQGPVCHTGSRSCFTNTLKKGFVYKLEHTIGERIDQNTPGSYTRALYDKGINKVAQKVGEEAVELVIEAMDDNIDLFKNEAADLLYHYLILLKSKGVSLEQIEQVLREREK